MVEIWYTTREAVKGALDFKETARANAAVDRGIAQASVAIEQLTHRKFYPWTGTRFFEWPNRQMGSPHRLWLDADELISVTSMVSGGVTIPPDQYFLEPANSGPPFTRVEINLAGNGAFSAGDTRQRAIEINGLFGYGADEVPAGALAASVTTEATTVEVTDSDAIGVGSLIRIGTERMTVTGKSMRTSGQLLQAPLAAQTNSVLVAVSNGAAFMVGEVILVDGERMLIVDIAGNNLVVKRSWDGSVLAAHTGSAIYVARTLTVRRGVLGTTAAAHDTAAPVARHQPPALVQQLALAEALNTVLQESAGYARLIGQGENAREAYARGLKDVRARVYDSLGRKARIRAV